MKKSIGKKMGILLVSCMLIFLYVQAGLAVESLSVVGFVKSIDSVTGIVTLDVTSEGCRGVRAFKVPDDAKGDLGPSLVGKKLQFKIDSVKCERGMIYNIVF